LGSASQAEIVQTTRLARKHGFDYFESGRGANASYEDTQFLELQTFMGMVGCGTAQGAARFQYRRGEDYGPHGDTHLRAVKPSEASFRRRSASTERASSSVRLDVEPPESSRIRPRPDSASSVSASPDPGLLVGLSTAFSYVTSSAP